MLVLLPSEVLLLLINKINLLDLYRLRLVCKCLKEFISQFSLKFHFLEKLHSSDRLKALKEGIFKNVKKELLYEHILSWKDLNYLINNGMDISSFKLLIKLFISDPLDINTNNLVYLIGRYGHTIELLSDSKELEESLEEGLCYYRGNFNKNTLKKIFK